MQAEVTYGVPFLLDYYEVLIKELTTNCNASTTT